MELCAKLLYPPSRFDINEATIISIMSLMLTADRISAVQPVLTPVKILPVETPVLTLVEILPVETPVEI